MNSNFDTQWQSCVLHLHLHPCDYHHIQENEKLISILFHKPVTHKMTSWMQFDVCGWLCFTSHLQRGHLETAPPFTAPCEGREARFSPTGNRPRGHQLHERCLRSWQGWELSEIPPISDYSYSCLVLMFSAFSEIFHVDCSYPYSWFKQVGCGILGAHCPKTVIIVIFFTFSQIAAQICLNFLWMFLAWSHTKFDMMCGFESPK